ncbi:hypothetical protein [Luteithermobacter gelatinilyticus]|uniref:hypothetical protein n=1 Tax=Luteithermobacter gelatinilyticus TaxID=2582913 RepID=UPI00110746E3|nr:hypothetical protein [Luteithermobacter gelatinilyticus]
MTSIIPHLLQDDEAASRVARVLLRHVRPRTKDEALHLLDSKLGVYLQDRTSLSKEVDQYFRP